MFGFALQNYTKKLKLATFHTIILTYKGYNKPKNNPHTQSCGHGMRFVFLLILLEKKHACTLHINY